MVIRKTPDEIEQMARAGAMLAQVHEVLRDAVRPGISTADLDRLAEREIRQRGGEPSFLGYRGYSATINASLNDEIVHGIPAPDRRLVAGNVLSVDCGVLLDGFHSDSACTWVVGGDEHAPAAVRALIDATRDALWRGIEQLRPGRRAGDVSAAIGAVADRHGYGVVADHDGWQLGGHGIGRSLHEDPLLLNRGRPGRGLRIRPGLVFAVEPMFTLGSPAFRLLADGWTIVATDGSLAAHWEHTVAITEDGPWVLTARAGEPVNPGMDATVTG
ncbi:MAG TPA: type I methionyl aminopeptidase [Mycobacteriales bacterium]|nr:type I methionyl aminopeptidase [Mycobacteriales bacterium]